MKKIILAIILIVQSCYPVHAKRLSQDLSEEIWRQGKIINGPSWTDARPGKDASFFSMKAWIVYKDILYHCVAGSVANQKTRHWGFNAQCRNSEAE